MLRALQRPQNFEENRDKILFVFPSSFTHHKNDEKIRLTIVNVSIFLEDSEIDTFEK
jgi:Mg2+ and Co2+ transporter CorA